MTGALMRDRPALLQACAMKRTTWSSGRLAHWRPGMASSCISVRRQSMQAPARSPIAAGFLRHRAKKIATYDKIHMFDVDLDNGESWRESAACEPGRQAVIAELPFAKVGMAICYDIRFPQLFRHRRWLAQMSSPTLLLSRARLVKPIGTFCSAHALSRMARS